MSGPKHGFQKTRREDFERVSPVGPIRGDLIEGIPMEMVIKFFKEYKRSGWNAGAAAREVHPNIGNNAAYNYGRWYLGLLDPYKVFLPRRQGEKSIFMSVMKQEIYSPKSPDENQRVFEALFEKYGANGMKSALLAVQEIHPDVKPGPKGRRGHLLRYARKYLSNSNYTFDLITALEARGIDANKAADKLMELLNAKRKRTVKIKGDLVEESDEVDSPAIDKALSHILKIGIGGGYAPERSAVLMKDVTLGKALEELDSREARDWNRNLVQEEEKE